MDVKKLLPKLTTKKKVAVIAAAAVLLVLSLVLKLLKVTSIAGALPYVAVIVAIVIEKGSVILKKLSGTKKQASDENSNKELEKKLAKASNAFNRITSASGGSNTIVINSSNDIFKNMSSKTSNEIAIILADIAVMLLAIAIGMLNFAFILFPVIVAAIALAMANKSFKREKWEAFVASEDEIIIDFILTIRKWYAKEQKYNRDTKKLEETGESTVRYFDNSTKKVVMQYIEKNCKPNWPKGVTVDIETAASYILLHKDEVFETGELKDVSFPIINYDADKLVDDRVIEWTKKFFNCAPDGEVHNQYLEYMFRLNHSLIFKDQFSCLSVAFEHGHTCDAAWLYDEKIFDVGKIKERMESGGKFLDILKENNISILNGKE